MHAIMTWAKSWHTPWRELRTSIDRSRNRGRALVVFEIDEDAMAQIERSLEQRPARRKRWLRVGGELRRRA